MSLTREQKFEKIVYLLPVFSYGKEKGYQGGREVFWQKMSYGSVNTKTKLVFPSGEKEPSKLEALVYVYDRCDESFFGIGSSQQVEDQHIKTLLNKRDTLQWLLEMPDYYILSERDNLDLRKVSREMTHILTLIDKLLILTYQAHKQNNKLFLSENNDLFNQVNKLYENFMLKIKLTLRNIFHFYKENPEPDYYVFSSLEELIKEGIDRNAQDMLINFERNDKMAECIMCINGKRILTKKDKEHNYMQIALDSLGELASRIYVAHNLKVANHSVRVDAYHRGNNTQLSLRFYKARLENEQELPAIVNRVKIQEELQAIAHKHHIPIYELKKFM